MKVQITKAQRLATASALAQQLSEAFGIPAPTVAHGEGSYDKADCRSVRVDVPTSAGPLSMCIEVCPRIVSVFAQFDGRCEPDDAGYCASRPLTDAQRGMAVRMNGNWHSGKINFHAGPDGKASQAWLDNVVDSIRRSYFDRMLVNC